MKIAHLVKDEKFIDSAWNVFEDAAPGCNHFYVSGRRRDLSYIKEFQPLFCGRAAYLNPFFINKLSGYNLVILHSLTAMHAKIAARLTGKVPLLWIGMGYDYYDLMIEENGSLLMSKTNEVFSRFLASRKGKTSTSRLEEVLFGKSSDRLAVIKGIDYFSPVLKEEFQFLNEKYPGVFKAYVPWNYRILSSLIGRGMFPKTISGRNILLGNSAAITNNHIEAIDLVSEIGLPEGAKVIAPLSYGDEYCRDYVTGYGESAFGDKFVSITQFMDIQKYMDLLSSCSHIFMNQRRQQGLGNISLGLLMGARVIVNSENLVYGHFSEMGCFINSTEELHEDPTLLSRPLSEEERSVNREIIISNSSYANHLERTRALVRRCTS